MTAAALIRESLGRVTPTARQVTVDAVVYTFAREVAGLEVFPPRRPEDARRRFATVALWGREAAEASTRAAGYSDVTAVVVGVVHGLIRAWEGGADGD